MKFLSAICLGIIEGITEFLPISSTYHLLLVSRLLHLPHNEFTKLFHIFIQSGAILAVVWLYRYDLIRRLDLGLKTLVAFVPTALMGIIFYRPIKDIFMERFFLQVIIFLLLGLLFILFELLIKKAVLKLKKTLVSLTFFEAILIGFIQCLAFFPGVSRSGAVILMMMIFGYRRDEAAFFSFFLSIPTIISAGIYDLYKSWDSLVSFKSGIFPLSLGFSVSFIVALAAVRWFIGYLKKHSLNLFAFYRFLLGVLTILWLSLE